MPPKVEVPDGFQKIYKPPNKLKWNHVAQGTGQLSNLQVCIGSDNASPCVVLYIQFTDNTCYVAHIDNGLFSIKIQAIGEMNAVKAAARARWAAIVQQRSLNLAGVKRYCFCAGISDTAFASLVVEVISESLVAATNKQPMQPWSDLKGFTGFIMPSQDQGPEAKPILLTEGDKPQLQNWESQDFATAGDVFSCRAIYQFD